MTGGDLLARALARRGVQFVTTLSGNGLDPLYMGLKRAGIGIADFRNEQAAAYAADAAARLTGRLAVCAVSSAVGHVNALSGLLNAWFDGSPMLLISGSSDHARADQGRFQELDQVPLAAPLCKYARYVDRPELIAYYVQEAIARATAGRPGPAHLTVPMDILSAEVPDSLANAIPASPAEARPHAAADPVAVVEVAELLSRAERPVIVAGSGAFYARASAELAALAERLALPVVVPIWDRGAFERSGDWFLGVVGAASGGPRLLPDADLVLVLGAQVDYRLGYGEPPEIARDARVVRVDVESASLGQGRMPDVAIQSDPRSFAAALDAASAQLGAQPKRAWLAETRRRLAEFQRQWSGAGAPGGPMTGRDVVQALQPIVSSDSESSPLFLVDGGNIGQWAHQVLADRYPRDWLTCGASGVVGWGLGGAIGAKLAHPERPVLLLSGDGAIGFTIAELETAVRLGTPFVVVLADDRAWGIVLTGQLAKHGREGVIASELAPVAYDRVAEGFGAVGMRVEAPEALEPTVREALASGKTTLIHVPIVHGGPTD